MGTRSRIGVMHGDNVKSVYCHWDGYLQHNGAILQEHYDSAKANQLVALGDLSSLRPNIGEKHAFSQFELRAEEVAGFKLLTENMCTFYGRDRGETGADKKKFKDYEDYAANHQYEEYDYILRNDNGVAVWFVCDHDGAYVTLESAIMDEQDRIAQEETA